MPQTHTIILIVRRCTFFFPFKLALSVARRIPRTTTVSHYYFTFET